MSINRENSKAHDDILHAVWLIEEKIEPYIQEHKNEVLNNDKWIKEDISEIEETLENVKMDLNYLTLVIDTIGGIKY